ncbi:hypothetical protein EZV61_03495 [Corallincola luteus]|uniref:Uncharacterized protein n=1 Tax=Corallincola luteus TaxID=1775177 RepID=A0ABY2AQ00_9GAMM|nr:hypothetical protein [Corallincola luteus]TCI05041.1 hypothetical protein EZV61_03495 [Corallincola luteus]
MPHFYWIQALLHHGSVLGKYGVRKLLAGHELSMSLLGYASGDAGVIFMGNRIRDPDYNRNR